MRQQCRRSTDACDAGGDGGAGLANLFRTNTDEQSQINSKCVEQLALYREAPRHANDNDCSSKQQGGRRREGEMWRAARACAWDCFATLRTRRTSSFFQTVSALARLLGGGRITLCSNGRDRTSMRLTNEHGQLLQDYHGLDEAAVARRRDA